MSGLFYAMTLFQVLYYSIIGEIISSSFLYYKNL